MASASSSRQPSPSLHRRRRRSSTADSQSNHPEYIYAQSETSVSEWLKCPICLNPFVEPIQASSCEHIFCRGCINQHLDSSQQLQDDDEVTDSSSCPSCRSPISQKHLKPAAALIRNMVDSLIVRCPHEKRGCLHTCERSFVEVHARRDCEWAYVGEYAQDTEDVKRMSRARCECGRKVLRKDWREHIESSQCSVIRVRCRFPGCDEILKDSEMDDHIAICPAQPIACFHCNTELPRGQMDQHENTCDEAMTSCKFARFGCDWQGTRGQNSSEHVSQCRLIPLEVYLLKQEKDVLSLQDENRRLVESVEGLKQEQQKMMTLLQQCITCIGSTYIDSNALLSSSFPTHLPEEITIESLPVATPREDQIEDEANTPQNRLFPPLDIASMPPRPDYNTRDFHHLVSTSAPASRAEVPWQWPDHSTPSRSMVVQPPSSLATVSDSLAEIDKKLSGIFERMSQIDRKMEDNHVLGLNANFEASRAHEELNSVRHGLHALRISVSSLALMHDLTLLNLTSYLADDAAAKKHAWYSWTSSWRHPRYGQRSLSRCDAFHKWIGTLNDGSASVLDWV
jgi:hypothetical protein